MGPQFVQMSTEEGLGLRRNNYRAKTLVGLFVAIVIFAIVARFLGKLVGATPLSSFLSFIYRVSSPLVAPFQGIFANGGSGTNTIETASLVALPVYAVLGWALIALVRRLRLPSSALDGKPSVTSTIRRVLTATVPAILATVLVLIVIRGLCLVLGASSDSGLVNFIYHVSAPVVSPFQGIFPNGGTSKNVVEVASSLAIIVYLLAGYALLALINIVTTPPGTEPEIVGDVGSGSSPYYYLFSIVLFLAAIAGGLPVFDRYMPATAHLASPGSVTPGSNSGSNPGRSIPGGSDSAPTSIANPGPFCQTTDDAKQNGWSMHHRVDTRSNTLCYSHWNISLASGPGCGFWLNGNQYSAPGNIWNIVAWGETTGRVYAALSNGDSFQVTCVTNLRNYPQTILYSRNFS